MYKFLAEFAIKVSQVVAVSLAWLPVVCENIIIYHFSFNTSNSLQSITNTKEFSDLVYLLTFEGKGRVALQSKTKLSPCENF